MPPVSEELGAGDASTTATTTAAAAAASPLAPLEESEAVAVSEEGKPANGGWLPPEKDPLAAGGVGDTTPEEEEGKEGKENGELLQPPPPPPPPSPPPPEEDVTAAAFASSSAAAESFEPPEGGWGWLVMLASMWCNGAVFGIQNSCGVLFKSMLSEFGDPEDKQLMFRTALVNSLSMGMIFFCSPIVSIFTNIFGCRKVAVGGAAVAFIGLLSSSFVSSLGPLYFTYGILFGCGCSFTYQPSLVILGHYFKKRLGLVNGIVTAGSSLFTVTLPFLLNVLIESVGLYNTFRVLCSFVFVLFLAGFTYKPLIPSAKTSGGKGKFNFPPAKTIFNFSIFKITSYRIWAFGIPAALFGYFIPYVHLLKHVKERIGEDVPDVTLLLCLGITSGVGRLVFGRIADYIPGAKKVYLQVISFFFIGLMSMMIPLCYTFGGLIAVCLFMGLFDGCFISIMAPIAFELVGAQYVSQAIGFLLGFMSVPMTVGPPIAGQLRDLLGTYDVAFYLAGVPPIIGGAVLCFIPWVHEKEKSKEQASPVDGETTEKMLEIKSTSGLDSFVKPGKESESVI
ncbi:monocarboxylate transporter 10 [Sceloporus undulatus]|uniref:monocarboxylate transporter 10 n=1 Tax=Sceloporus undulatus TaxID=8520 RepID=UPI001C4B7280|nr:monocarboxylate transporter 10 [Sceloporus undulatus]